jgi:hypothetical protein
MVLLLIAVTQQSQVFLSTAEVIVDTASDPLVIGMGCHAVAHDLGNGLEGFGERFY